MNIILENNKLIAVFYGITKTNGYSLNADGSENYQYEIDINDMKYLFYWDNIAWFRDAEILRFHKSWDWLMPIIEKIEKLGCNVRIQGTLQNTYVCDIVGYEMEKPNHSSIENFKIDAVYNAVIKFIKWYNK